MRRLESLWGIFIHVHFACQRRLGVLLVDRELLERHGVARARRVRWLEGSVVLHGWRRLGLGFTRGNIDILTDDVLVVVEQMRLLCKL